MSFLCFIVFLLTIVANPRIKLSVCHSSPTGITVDLVHRDHIASPQLSRAERLKQMVYRDMQRVESMSRNNVGSTDRRQTLEDGKSTALTTIAAGRDYGIAEYIVKLRVGTPPQDVLMIPVTGTVLNILKCDYKGKRMSEGPSFNADNSTSFKGIPCELGFCSNNLTFLATQSSNKVCHDNSTCAYSDYGYGGLSTSGFFAYENFTFTQQNGEDIVLNNMLIGCSTSGKKLSRINGTHGILGLGNFPLSFPWQVSQVFGSKFSMCLVDHLSSLSTSSGIFLFGTVPKEKLPSTMSYTTLDISSHAYQRLYCLNINGVYINGAEMDIPRVAWDNMNVNGGTIVDTGTSLTYLNNMAYEPITGALNQTLSRFISPVIDEAQQFEYFYDSSKGYDESLVPKLEIEFEGRVKLQPHPKSYLIDVAPGLKCLGFKPLNANGYSIIGNILLQEHFVEFDVDNLKFGFGKSACNSTTYEIVTPTTLRSTDNAKTPNTLQAETKPNGKLIQSLTAISTCQTELQGTKCLRHDSVFTFPSIGLSSQPLPSIATNTTSAQGKSSGPGGGGSDCSIP